MDQTSLNNLDFPKILNIISSYSYCEYSKELIQQIKPTSDISYIENSLDELDELKSVTDIYGKLPLAGLVDLRPIFLQLEKNYHLLSYQHFCSIKNVLIIWSNIKKYFSKFENDKPNSPTQIIKPHKLLSKISPVTDLISIIEKINSTFNELGEIKDTASSKLCFIRHEITKTKKQIETHLTEFINKNIDIIQDNYFTIRNERYVIPIKSSHQDLIQGLVHDQSGSGQTLFIEPISLLPLNNKLIKLYSEEKEEIANIISELVNLIKNRIYQIQTIFEILVFLDILQAKLVFAQKYNANRPQISSHQLTIENARHPLLHPNCVPLTLTINTMQSCILITGPNGGGKTVALKIIGINCLLLQSGCYVLADKNSNFKIFDKILSDIGEYQTIEGHLSTFTSHLKRIKEILDIVNTTSNSLILLDEIGTGTNPEEGSLLAYGILKELRNKGAFVLATSHYDLLKNFAFTTPGFVNACMEFDYTTLQPTYKFIIGIPGKSNALAIAKQFKLPDNVLNDLQEYYQNKTIKQETKLIEVLEREKSHYLKLKQLQYSKLSEIKNKEREINKIYSELIEFRKSKKDKVLEEFINKTQSFLQEIESLIHKSKKLLDQLQKSAINFSETNSSTDLLNCTLNDLRKIHKKIKFDSKLIIQELDKNLSKSAESIKNTILSHPNNSNLDSESAYENNSYYSNNLQQYQVLELGKKVFLPNSSNIGEIVEIIKEKNIAKVEYNGIIINIPLNELTPAQKIADTSNQSKVFYNPIPQISEKIDLRGLRVEEAITKIEEFLKLAEINQLEKVYIIHGKGTGVLQKAVKDYLSKSSYKNKFRPGRYDEGDLGVTVVEIIQK